MVGFTKRVRHCHCCQSPLCKVGSFQKGGEIQKKWMGKKIIIILITIIIKEMPKCNMELESLSDEIFSFALAHCVLQVNISLKRTVKVLWIFLFLCLAAPMCLFVLVKESAHNSHNAKDDEDHNCYNT